MPLPLIPLAIAGGLALAGAGATAYGASKKVPKATPVAVKPTAFGGGNDLQEQQLRREMADREATALSSADRYAKDAEGARGLQASAYDRYQQQAEGRGPSLAAKLAEQSANRMAAVQAQSAASARGGGGNQLLAQRMAMQQGAVVGQQGAAQASQMRMQEQMEGMRGMADMSTRMREGDLAARGMSEQRAAGSLGARMGMEGTIYEGGVRTALAEQQSTQAAQMANIERRQREKDRWFQMGGQLLGMGGQMGSAMAGKG